MSRIEEDDRFKHIFTDPKFVPVSKKQKKFKLDNRFKQMLTDKDWKVTYTVDKRGRPLNQSSKDNLEKFYKLQDSDDSSAAEESKSKKKLSKKLKKKARKIEEEEEDSSNTSDDDENPSIEALARGEGGVESSDSDSDWSVPGEIQDEIDHGWGELDADAEEVEEASSRLAVCNMDWDRVQAADVLVLLKSFLPQSGSVKTVTVYPSDFGLQRMKEEEQAGPKELKMSKEDDRSELERLREHQFQRLKYFYAVAECDSSETAQHVYDACNGIQLGNTGNLIDLRFIPDDMEFEQEARDSCSQTDDSYRPLPYTTSALQQTKVTSSWEEPDARRAELTQQLMTCSGEQIWQHMSAADKLLAPASSSEDDDENDVDIYAELKSDFPEPKRPKQSSTRLLQMFREAAGLIEKQADDDKADDQVSEHSSEEDNLSDEESPAEKKPKLMKAERKTKQKKSKADNGGFDLPADFGEGTAAFSDDDLPGHEQPAELLEIMGVTSGVNLGKKDKKKKKKKKGISMSDASGSKEEEAALSLLAADEEGKEKKRHFSLKALQQKALKKKKRKSRKPRDADSEDECVDADNDGFKMDVEDSRFSAVFSKAEYNIDPTAPEYRETDGIKQLINAKVKRKRAKHTS